MNYSASQNFSAFDNMSYSDNANMGWKFTASKKIREQTKISRGTSKSLKRKLVGEERKRAEVVKQKTMKKSSAKMKKEQFTLPLSKIILADLGNSTEKLPNLLTGFYDWTKQAKIGRKTHFLRLFLTSKSPQDEKEYEEKGELKGKQISIPISLDEIEKISVVSGMKPFEQMMMAHSKSIALHISIERLRKVIENRSKSLQKEKTQLKTLNETLEKSKYVDENNASNKKLDSAMQELPGKVASEADETEIDDTKGLKGNENEKENLEGFDRKKQGAEAEKAGQKKLPGIENDDVEMGVIQKKVQIKKKNLVAKIGKLEASLLKAEQKFKKYQTQLEKINKTFGTELEYFQDKRDNVEVLEYFQSKLKEGKILELDDNQSEVTENQGEELEREGPGECTACKAKLTGSENFCVECGAPQKKSLQKAVGKITSEVITETPIWIAIILKKQLEKFFASQSNLIICEKGIVDRAELILMKFQPLSTVLKNMVQESTGDYLKLLNEAFKGPWKDLRVSPEVLLQEKSPYSLENTLQYLVKCLTRKEVNDKRLENCELCQKELKHMFLERHRKQFCIMREMSCKHCDAKIIAKMVKDHEKSCPKWPVPCPQKCDKVALQRFKIEEHLQTCINSIVECEFKLIGCNKEVKRKDYDKHLKENAWEHVKFLNARVWLISTYFTRNKDAHTMDLDPALLGESDIWEKLHTQQSKFELKSREDSELRPELAKKTKVKYQASLEEVPAIKKNLDEAIHRLEISEKKLQQRDAKLKIVQNANACLESEVAKLKARLASAMSKLESQSEQVSRLEKEKFEVKSCIAQMTLIQKKISKAEIQKKMYVIGKLTTAYERLKDLTSRLQEALKSVNKEKNLVAAKVKLAKKDAKAHWESKLKSEKKSFESKLKAIASAKSAADARVKKLIREKNILMTKEKAGLKKAETVKSKLQSQRENFEKKLQLITQEKLAADATVEDLTLRLEAALNSKNLANPELKLAETNENKLRSEKENLENELKLAVKEKSAANLKVKELNKRLEAAQNSKKMTEKASIKEKKLRAGKETINKKLKLIVKEKDKKIKELTKRLKAALHSETDKNKLPEAKDNSISEATESRMCKLQNEKETVKLKLSSLEKENKQIVSIKDDLEKKVEEMTTQLQELEGKKEKMALTIKRGNMGRMQLRKLLDKAKQAKADAENVRKSDESKYLKQVAKLKVELAGLKKKVKTKSVKK